MGEAFHDTAASGALWLAIPVAVIAGVVSFFSPCVIPLLPGYLSYATGLSGQDLAAGEADHRRGRMLVGSSLFVLGFTVVFVLLGAAFGSIGHYFFAWRDTLNVVLGILTMVLGLMFAGWIPGLQRDWRIHKVPAVGLGAAPLLGFLFGLGWTPCLGPTLAAIQSLALSDGDAVRGGVLSAFYAAGLGIPFIVTAVMWRRALGAIAIVRRHQVWVSRVGGAMLIAVGVALATGLWDDAVVWLQVHLVNDWVVSV